MSDKVYYRGQSKCYSGNISDGKDIIPSILRYNKKHNIHFSLLTEREYYLNSSSLMKDVLETSFSKETEITAKTLGILQHYGFLTRLIDITENIDVATYFACCSNFDEDGYVYTIKPNDKLKPIGDDWKASVTRKIETIMLSNQFLSQKVNLKTYFTEKEKVSYIKKTSIEDAVILDYKSVFKKTDLDNLRSSRQEGKFILLGNYVDNDFNLLDQINESIFNTLEDPIAIKNTDKINTLYELSKVSKNFVNLFPDDEESILLVSKYHEIKTLKRRNILEDFIKTKFIYNNLHTNIDHEFIDYVNYIIDNTNNLLDEFIRNENYFYFIFKEIVDYFMYYYNIHRKNIANKYPIGEFINIEYNFELTKGKETINKIIKAA